MVTVVTPAEILGAYQISVVVPLALADCAARDQVPPPLILLTWLTAVPRVEITATRVFPALVAVRPETEIVVEPLPESPVALCTRTGVSAAVIVREPTSLLERKPLPLNVRFPPSRLLPNAKSAASPRSSRHRFCCLTK